MSLWFWIQRLRAGDDRTRLRRLVSGQERTPQAIRLQLPLPRQSGPDVQVRPLRRAPDETNIIHLSVSTTGAGPAVDRQERYFDGSDQSDSGDIA